ncbi:MAG: DUF4330 domain-containing protein [Lachnospiraceae bacterium]
MIDEKGRLFGKVNIVDLLIIIIILAAGAFLGMKLLGPDSAVANTQKVRVTLYCEETPNYVANSLKPAPRSGTAKTTSPLGYLTDWRTGGSKSAPSPTSPARSWRSHARTIAPPRWSARAKA